MKEEIKLIDTHSHLHFGQYDEDRDVVIDRMRKEAVQTIVVGTDLDTSKQAIALAEKYPDVVVGATIGVHPNDTDEEFDVEAFSKILNGKVVAVGECGLDYFIRGDVRAGTEVCGVCEKADQEKKFIEQIDFALENDLPLMLHIRPSKDSADAHEDALRILQDYKNEHGEKLRGTCHFFTGTPAVAMQYVELGFYISFPGVITFASETHDAVREVPLERILSETDAPYAAPVPHRGERNEPIFVVEVVKKVAAIKQIDEETVQEQLVINAKKLFAIKARL